MNNRRKLVIALGAGVLAPQVTSFAQQPPLKIHRIGVLGVASATTYARQVDALRAGLRELGYVEGKNLEIEFRWADGKVDQLPRLAAELMRTNPDIVLTSGPGNRIAKQATNTIPIVMAVSSDAIATGLVASLAHPGGNITGSTSFGVELDVKRLELIKEALPHIQRVAVMFDSSNPEFKQRIETMLEAMARTLKVELRHFGVSGPGEMDNAFLAMQKQRIEALLLHSDTSLVANASTVATFAAKYRMPSIGSTELVEAGGLMAYSVNFPALWRRAAVFADKILKGARPGDLPIERPTTFDFTINEKAAKALGIKFPQSIIVQANTVTE
jgi:putative ABC transport system substrate-binding protein